MEQAQCHRWRADGCGNSGHGRQAALLSQAIEHIGMTTLQRDCGVTDRVIGLPTECQLHQVLLPLWIIKPDDLLILNCVAPAMAQDLAETKYDLEKYNPT